MNKCKTCKFLCTPVVAFNSPCDDCIHYNSQSENDNYEPNTHSIANGE